MSPDEVGQTAMRNNNAVRVQITFEIVVCFPRLKGVELLSGLPLFDDLCSESGAIRGME